MQPKSKGRLLDRVFELLSCFSEDEHALTAAELSRRSNIALSTTHRLIAELLKNGALMKQPGHTYSIGSKLWELGELSPHALVLRENAIPHLMRMYEATAENVHLGVLDGGDPANSSVLYVGRVTGKLSIPTVSRAGGRGPLHATGVGKAILASRDEPWLKDFFKLPLVAETTKTLTTEKEMRDSIEHARRVGYATTREEMTLGNISVAAVLPTMPGIPPAAVGLVVHIENADIPRLGALVQQTARDISKAVRSH